jgi:hypothetical protein
MFLGVSLTQLLFTIAVIVVVLYAFRIGARLGGDRREAALRADARRRRDRGRRFFSAGRSAAGGSRGGQQVEETVRCPACGAYVVPSETEPCGRDDCPQRRRGRA